MFFEIYDISIEKIFIGSVYARRENFNSVNIAVILVRDSISISLTEASKKLKIPVYVNVRSWHTADRLKDGESAMNEEGT